MPTEVIATVLPLHLFMQFWYHTRHINKMGILEYILVTPSHHRVHHAINEEYLDKNLSQIFIFWDFIFGTFQKELDDVPPVYGISRPASTRNPFKINFQHLWIMVKDAWRAEKIIDKITIWFRPTGWRPAGFDEKYPVHKIDDVASNYDFASGSCMFVIWFVHAYVGVEAGMACKALQQGCARLFVVATKVAYHQPRPRILLFGKFFMGSRLLVRFV